MHFFLLFVAVLAFVLNVDAAAILNKRASPDVQSCIVDINQVSAQLGTVETTIANAAPWDVGNEYGRLQDNLSSAKQHCCAINAAVSDADADEFLASLGVLTSKVQGTLQAISNKRADYNAIYRFIIRQNINTFEQATTELNGCFSKFTPGSRASTLQGYYNTIQSEFSTVKTNYDMKK